MSLSQKLASDPGEAAPADNTAPEPFNTGAPPVHRHRAEIAHSVHGRVRLKFPDARHHPALLEQLRTTISEIEGIDAVDVKAASAAW